MKIKNDNEHSIFKRWFAFWWTVVPIIGVFTIMGPSYFRGMLEEALGKEVASAERRERELLASDPGAPDHLRRAYASNVQAAKLGRRQPALLLASAGVIAAFGIALAIPRSRAVLERPRSKTISQAGLLCASVPMWIWFATTLFVHVLFG